MIITSPRDQPQECRVKCSSGAVLRNQWVTKPLKLNPPRRKALGTITVFLQGLIWLSQASNPQIFFFLNHHLGNIDPSIHFQYLFIPVLTVRGLLEPNPAVIGQGRIHPGQATSSMQGHTERRSFILTLADTNRHFSIIFFCLSCMFLDCVFWEAGEPRGNPGRHREHMRTEKSQARNQTSFSSNLCFWEGSHKHYTTVSFILTRRLDILTRLGQRFIRFWQIDIMWLLVWKWLCPRWRKRVGGREVTFTRCSFMFKSRVKSWQQRVCVGDALTQRRPKDDEAWSFVTSVPLRLCCFRRGRRQQTSHTDLHHVTFGKEPHLDLPSQMVAFFSIYFATFLQSRDRRKCAWVHMPVAVSVCMCVTWEVIFLTVITHSVLFFQQHQQQPIDTY